MSRGKKRIGILGGTFNPIHIGHLILAENAYWQFELDYVLIMPSNKPPHKTTATLVENKDRLEMVRLAIEENPHFELSLIEYEREGFTYTADTLYELTNSNPENEYFFIIGGDSLSSIEHWRNPAQIFQLANIIATKRDDMNQQEMMNQIHNLKNKYNASIYPLHSPRIDLSSNEIRERVRNGQSIKYYVPATVETYIQEHNLYQGK